MLVASPAHAVVIYEAVSDYTQNITNYFCSSCDGDGQTFASFTLLADASVDQITYNAYDAAGFTTTPTLFFYTGIPEAPSASIYTYQITGADIVSTSGAGDGAGTVVTANIPRAGVCCKPGLRRQPL